MIQTRTVRKKNTALYTGYTAPSLCALLLIYSMACNAVIHNTTVVKGPRSAWLPPWLTQTILQEGSEITHIFPVIQYCSLVHRHTKSLHIKSSYTFKMYHQMPNALVRFGTDCPEATLFAVACFAYVVLPQHR